MSDIIGTMPKHEPELIDTGKLAIQFLDASLQSEFGGTASVIESIKNYINKHNVTEKTLRSLMNEITKQRRKYSIHYSGLVNIAEVKIFLAELIIARRKK